MVTGFSPTKFARRILEDGEPIKKARKQLARFRGGGIIALSINETLAASWIMPSPSAAAVRVDLQAKLLEFKDRHLDATQDAVMMNF